MQEQGWECAGFSEINEYAAKVYSSHFPSHHNYGDITRIAAESLPDFDLLCGGFPCQAFSLAGRRLGFSDTRGTLFFDLARILRAKRPRLCVFENVKGLLSHDEGRTFKTIISALDDVGYDCQWQVLNSRHFGVPQNRERVFIVGHLRGESRPEVFPLAGTHGACASELASTTIDANYWKGIGNHGARTAIIRLSDSGMNRIAGWTETEKRVFAFQGDAKRSTVQEHVYHKPADNTDTLSTGHVPKLLDGATIRKLTPLECERLQGFPDGWTAGLSDTQRYKCLGNAVTVNVVRAIVSRLSA